MRTTLLILMLIVCCQLTLARDENKDSHRNGRLLSLFEIVRFPNDPCIGSTSQNGTCYTDAECQDRGGTSQGSCASGYGVCCIFALGCGRSSSENCTYFESSGNDAGDCTLQICKCDTNVCQLRLDFMMFVIADPSDSTDVAGAFNGVNIASETQCVTDSFSVTNPNGNTPPVICGTNNNEHMYVDASDACNDLVFQLGTAATAPNRQWNIKVTQYSCDYDNLAPTGCTQYFFGPTTGNIMTYNFQGGRHLARQNQNICIRRERGQCRICYTAAAAIDFSVSGMTPAMGFALQSSCCGYGAAGIVTKGYDCVNIPGAKKTGGTTLPSNLCGDTLVSMAGTNAGPGKTVCSTRVPFEIRFLSDNFEFEMEALKDQGGFNLAYTMDNTNCN